MNSAPIHVTIDKLGVEFSIAHFSIALVCQRVLVPKLTMKYLFQLDLY